MVRQHGAYIGRSLRYLGVAESDLDDAAQEVFLVVHRRLDSFEERSTLRTWLYGICVKVAAAQRRRAARREDPVEQVPERPVLPEQHAALERTEARRRLSQVLNQLDEDKRAVFVLFEIERLPMKDVASALSIPLQTAYYRHQAARKRVLSAFQEGRDSAPEVKS